MMCNVLLKGKRTVPVKSPYEESSLLKICPLCGSRNLVSRVLCVCGECLSEGSKEAMQRASEAHRISRLRYDLPPEPPKSKNGLNCTICANECVCSIGERGYCGLTINDKGKLVRSAGTPEHGLFEFYYDPLPTNCVADWCCPGGTGSGYPQFAYRNGPEYGHMNLAVFYGACSFDCLFCQNWAYKENIRMLTPIASAQTLADNVSERVSCICYFGGDPAPQLPHAIRSSEIALQESKGRILRVCWETNGSENWQLLKQAATLSLTSGGCIKFDIKSFNESLNIALCGVSNRRTLENFKLLSEFIPNRPNPPFLVASTLLVPGYIGVEEIKSIAEMIAGLDPSIPYSLLAFSPQYLMDDLPTTSAKIASECLEAAKSVGLLNVRIGNSHLLS
jgi:pyruvate formate lyase activating enzyme